jgi:hypothetical protein
VEVAPAMLGGSGVRHYFVIFTSESESRGLDGILANWAILRADNGQLTLQSHGRADDLSRRPGQEKRVVRGPPEYVERYSRFTVGRFFQDVTLSPDLPDVAQVIRQLYTGPPPAMGGTRIDGVLVVDPYALAALLSFLGQPIDLRSAGIQLTPQNATQELLVDQYQQFGDTSSRLDFLDDASTQTFEALTRGSIPGPDTIAKTLAPEVAARHLMFTAFRSDEQALFARLGATGAFPRAKAESDFLAVVGDNKANNKTDIWMHRTVDYQVTYDPATGHEDATETITLHNMAPTSGLSEGVIGSNGRGLPPGTNQTFLSVYSPLDCVSYEISGAPMGFESQIEFGYHVYSNYVTVPSGRTITVTLHLSGTIAATTHYEVGVAVQAMVNADEVNVAVTPTKGWHVHSASGLYDVAGGQRAERELPPGIGANSSINFSPN